jgi:hypothetical protein
MGKKTIEVKVGQPKMMESPEQLLELFQQYVAHVKAKPIMQHDFVGGMGKSVERKKERPLTMEGFENYVFMQGLNTELGAILRQSGGPLLRIRPHLLSR